MLWRWFWSKMINFLNSSTKCQHFTSNYKLRQSTFNSHWHSNNWFYFFLLYHFWRCLYLTSLNLLQRNRQSTLLLQLDKRRLKSLKLRNFLFDVKMQSWAKWLWIIFKLRILLMRHWQKWRMFRNWSRHLKTFVVRQKNDSNIIDALSTMHFDELKLSTKLFVIFSLILFFEKRNF